MIPKGWIKSQVSGICTLQNGNSFKPQDWDTKGLPIIRIQNLNGSNNFNYYAGPTQEKWLVETGQILFSWAGTRGVSFGPFIWKGNRGVLNQHIYKVFANDHINKDWLFFILKFITSKIEDKAHGFKATLLHVQKKDIDNQPILCPPLSEQRKIALILSTWDKAISTTERLIENSKQQKKALMQQLLTGNLRLLSDSGERFEGELEEVTLAEIFDISRGAVQSTSVTGRYNLVVMGSITKSGKLAKKTKTDAESNILDKGDLVMPERDIGKGFIIGRTALISENRQYVLGPNVLRLQIKETRKQIPEFWNLLSNASPFRRKIKKIVSGTSQLMTTSKDIKKIATLIPATIEEQQKIASVLTNADKEIDILEQQLADLKQEKKALMQQLLTGKRRVKVEQGVAA